MQDVYLTLPVGTVIRDRYVIEGLLGKGGYGSVYLVRDKRVKGNLFALKELIDSSKQERDRFTFECEVLRRLDHSSLPRVYHVFSNDADLRAYMLMDYIDGPNLEVLRKQQPDQRFSLSQTLKIMKPIMDAVSYLHHQQPPIIHRDIKPANIIAPSTGDEAVLVDFGIAKEYEPDSTTTSVRRCSPGYGAPEQYSSGTNTRTDIYGLGATFYALLSGIVPADAFYRMIQLGSNAPDTLEPISKFVPDLPELVADAIHRALSISIYGRFASVEEFWQALTADLREEEKLKSEPTVVTSSVTATPPSISAEQEVQGKTHELEPLVAASTPVSNDGASDADDATIVAERKSPSIQPPAQPPERERTALQPVKPPGSRASKVGIITGFSLLLLLIAVSVGAAFWSYSVNQSGTSMASKSQTATAHVRQTSKQHQRTTPTVSLTPISTPIGNGEFIAGTYNGSMFDVTTQQTSTIFIVVRQTRGSGAISGTFTFKSPSQGAYPLSGVVDAQGNFAFTVQPGAGQTPLYFHGSVQPGIYLRGYFCSSSVNHCDADASYFNVGPRF